MIGMTIVDALKQLYIALGGEESDFDTVTTTPEAILLIAALVGKDDAEPEVPAD